jgi:2-C-methyl-D-erythritol 4-phosphate cytidylyltransferase
LKLVFENRVVLTQPRESLYAIQTPQCFRFGPLIAAHRRALRDGVHVTDDAALLEWQGIPVAMVPGETGNLKITFAEDLDFAERLLRAPGNGAN